MDQWVWLRSFAIIHMCLSLAHRDAIYEGDAAYGAAHFRQ